MAVNFLLFQICKFHVRELVPVASDQQGDWVPRGE